MVSFSIEDTLNTNKTKSGKNVTTENESLPCYMSQNKLYFLHYLQVCQKFKLWSIISV